MVFLLKCFFFIAIAILSSSSISSASSSSHVRGEKSRDFSTRTLNNVNSRGLERCIEDKIFSERIEIGTKCVCKDTADGTYKNNGDDNEYDEGIVLVCSDQCAFCNDSRSVCGIKSVEALYDKVSGSKIGIGQVFEYLKLGSIEEEYNILSSRQSLPTVAILGIEELDCDEDADNHQLHRCSLCNVYFGGTKCNSCEVNSCGSGSGTFAPVMDCTNVQKNALFDFCQEVEMEGNSLFQAFLPDQFHRCLPMENLVQLE